jgi:hypothetical protein
MRFLLSTIFLFSLCSACTDEEATPSGRDASGADAVVHTDANVSRDAEASDAIVQADASEPDAEVMDALAQADAAAPDADAPDAADDAGITDAGFFCGALGSACSPQTPCVQQLECADPAQACVPEAPPMCGGFANQMCPAGLQCLYMQGTDYGLCFSQPTRDCICTQPAGMSGFFC